jgi:hypothetical protein
MQRGNTCQRVVGRLVEVRIEAGYRSVEDLEAMAGMVTAAFDQVPNHESVVLVADWRRCDTLMGAGIADRAVEVLTRVNPRILRGALVLQPDSPTAIMQLVRIVKESNHPNWQIFTSTEALCQWLGEVTSPEERARLVALLDRPSER